MIEPLTSTFAWPVVMLMNDPAVLLLRTKSKIAVAPVMLAPIRPMPCGTATVALGPTMMPLVFATYSEGVKPARSFATSWPKISDGEPLLSMLRIAPFAWFAVNTSVALLPTLKPAAFAVSAFGPVSALYVLPPHWITARPPAAALLRMMLGIVVGKRGKVLPFQICWPTVAAAPQTGAVPMQYRPAEESVVVAGTSTAINTPMPGRAPAGGAASAVPADIASATAATKGFTEKFFATAVFIMVFLPFMLIRPKKHSPGARH